MKYIIIICLLCVPLTLENNKPSKHDCIINSIIQVESRGNPNIKTYEKKVKRHSFGLMQVQCPTAKQLGFKGNCDKLLIPEINKKYGTLYYLKQFNRYKTIPKAIAAYNAGSVRYKNGKLINEYHVQKFQKYFNSCMLTN